MSTTEQSMQVGGDRAMSRRALASTARALVVIRDCLRVCADGYAAARTYEAMRHLADAELSRRGLSRATLGAEIVRRKERQRRQDGRSVQQVEEAMHRYPVFISPLANICKTAALLLILSGILSLLAHSIAIEDRAGRVAGSAKVEAR